MVSVGAYIDDSRYDNRNILKKSKCDLLFLFVPDEQNGLWLIRIMVNPASELAKKTASMLTSQLMSKRDKIEIELA